MLSGILAVLWVCKKSAHRSRRDALRGMFASALFMASSALLSERFFAVKEIALTSVPYGRLAASSNHFLLCFELPGILLSRFIRSCNDRVSPRCALA